MTHDIDDLLEMIRKLEERIIALEGYMPLVRTHDNDAYYWEHG